MTLYGHEADAACLRQERERLLAENERQQEALRQIIEATKDYTATNWYVAMQVISELALAGLGPKALGGPNQ